MNEYREIEVRFLEIDKDALVARLRELGAQDKGEHLLKEVICYDKALAWQAEGTKILRVRKAGDGVHMTFKDRPHGDTVDGTIEIELIVSDFDTAVLFLDTIGYPAFRHQEKLRHTFVLDNVMVEIDTWPRIPTYVELEGESKQALKDVAEKLSLDWVDVVTDNPRKVIEERYKIPVGEMRWFTFERFE
jgi:adenylate cyclase class 2